MRKFSRKQIFEEKGITDSALLDREIVAMIFPLKVNQHIIDIIDLILEKDNSNPIIVLQSDHGFRGPSIQATVDSPAVPSEYIGFANFSAMLLPSYCDVKVGDKFSLVNTFRLVFACIDGAVPDTLPNRFFKKIHGKLEEIYLEEITRR